MYILMQEKTCTNAACQSNAAEGEGFGSGRLEFGQRSFAFPSLWDTLPRQHEVLFTLP